MCSQDGHAKTHEDVRAVASVDESYNRWRHAVNELQDVDSVIVELKKELLQAEQERKIAIQKMSSLRQHLIMQGHSAEQLGRDPGATVEDEPMQKIDVDLADGVLNEKKKLGGLEPEMYLLDEQSDSDSNTNVIHEWEKGLEVIERTCSVQTTSSRLKLHLLSKSTSQVKLGRQNSSKALF